jgi:hypothetical protein
VDSPRRSEPSFPIEGEVGCQVHLPFEAHFDAGGRDPWNVGTEGEILRIPRGKRGYDAQSWGVGMQGWSGARQDVRAVWSLCVEDPRQAPEGTSVRTPEAFVVSGRGAARPALSYRARGSAWLPK